MSFTFQFMKDNPDVQKRKAECEQLREQYPDKIPIICEKDPNCKDLDEIEKTKFLVSNQFTVTQFNLLVRKRVGALDETCSLFLLANAQFNLTGDLIMSEVYEKYKNKEDGFLYIVYTSKEFFGNK